MPREIDSGEPVPNRQISTVASSLGALCLAEAFKKHGRIEIPSLNMAIVRTPEGSTRTVPLDDTRPEHIIKGLAQGAARPNSLPKYGKAPESMHR